LLAGRTEDRPVEITFTSVAAYGSFPIAEHFGLSGVLATITAGPVMGNVKSFCSTSERGERGRTGILGIRRLRCNPLIFFLIGMHARQIFGSIWIPAVLAIGLVMLGRAVAIYPCCFLFSRSSLRVTIENQHILL
jgi:CPA1 family monovalent cation:H+ antiporter